MYDKFAPLLEQALTEPGIVSQAFRRFHRFSVGNQILAAVQLRQKCLPLSPIASFSRWKALGRSVCKGQKALSLWMPITVKRRAPKRFLTIRRFRQQRRGIYALQTGAALVQPGADRR
jgi:hypothetical protein